MNASSRVADFLYLLKLNHRRRRRVFRLVTVGEGAQHTKTNRSHYRYGRQYFSILVQKFYAILSFLVVVLLFFRRSRAISRSGLRKVI